MLDPATKPLLFKAKHHLHMPARCNSLVDYYLHLLHEVPKGRDLRFMKKLSTYRLSQMLLSASKEISVMHCYLILFQSGCITCSVFRGIAQLYLFIYFIKTV